MDNIEKQALALINKVQADKGYAEKYYNLNRVYSPTEALYRAIESHEAFKKEVSDALKKVKEIGLNHAQEYLIDTFIIPTPVEPLVELMNTLGYGRHKTDEIRVALAWCGLEITPKKKAE